jgi:hypothetical protein
LRLKCHAPLVHIVNHMPQQIQQDLDARCWVLSESKKP